jgi:hypothetical protein
MPTDPTIENDEWRTFKRVLPLDVHEQMKYFEELVAAHSGIPARFQGIGNCVSVWSIICHLIRSYEPELMVMAEEWRGTDSGNPNRSTSEADGSEDS